MGRWELAPTILGGIEIPEILKDFSNDFGKNKKRKKGGPWKKRSISF